MTRRWRTGARGTGQHYIWANPDKREYIDDEPFEGTGFALGCSVTVGQPMTDAACTMIAGPWHGDTVIYVGDNWTDNSFDGSIIQDTASEKQQDMAEVAAGLMLPAEYRMKWYGEDAATAAGHSRTRVANPAAPGDSCCSWLEPRRLLRFDVILCKQEARCYTASAGNRMIEE